MIRSKKRRRRGQGIVEYILVTALMALAAITMFRTFREDIQQAYRKAGQAIVQGVDQSLQPEPAANE